MYHETIQQPDDTCKRRWEVREIIKHIKRWNRWRKNCLNSPIHKLLVLFKVIESPSMKWVWTKEYDDAFDEGFKKGLEEFVKLESEDKE